MAYIINLLIAIDQFFNALLGGNPDETISSRAGKLSRQGIQWAANLIDWFFGKGHCEENIEEDEP